MSIDCLKKAVVIGGSNGIGLAIVNKLISDGCFVEILDKSKPEEGQIRSGSYGYHYCDLLYLDHDYISSLASDKSVEVLMITAGFGRICDFEYMHTAEIRNMMTVNATSTIEILRLFYDRIKSSDKFYCGVMGSIAGLLSSPAASVYSASKAAVCRFVESVNIELEASGTSNRILNVSPATFKGSKFYGGDNQLELLEDLASQIVSRLFDSSVLFIPQYDEIFKDVIARYQTDPHEYGFHSYQYKKDSGRLDNERRVKIGYLSGTFDLFHVGHLNILKRARSECDYLIVGVHESGAWKGKETFIPFEERCEIIAGCKYVDKVVKSCPEDSDAWELYHYDKLFVGSDYKGSERFNRYEEFFKDKGVEIVYFPYTQSTNSTQIRKTVLLKTKDINLN
ncbi:cytidyltransferase-like protein [Ruminococcaceae bacterium R-25]|nr:cytidyltransferase-like protein [Ruminococcaceae bacterium R-25]SUQ11268.1 cytidyltransferase-like domain-containing protein [Oscillospiraceae bacterium]